MPRSVATRPFRFNSSSSAMSTSSYFPVSLCLIGTYLLIRGAGTGHLWGSLRGFAIRIDSKTKKTTKQGGEGRGVAETEEGNVSRVMCFEPPVFSRLARTRNEAKYIVRPRTKDVNTLPSELRFERGKKETAGRLAWVNEKCPVREGQRTHRPIKPLGRTNHLLKGPNSPDWPLTNVLVAISSSFLALFSIVLASRRKTQEDGKPGAAAYGTLSVHGRCCTAVQICTQLDCTEAETSYTHTLRLLPKGHKQVSVLMPCDLGGFDWSSSGLNTVSWVACRVKPVSF